MRLLNSSLKVFVEFVTQIFNCSVKLLFRHELWNCFLPPSLLNISSTLPKLIPLLTPYLWPHYIPLQVLMIHTLHFALSGGELRTLPSLW